MSGPAAWACGTGSFGDVHAQPHGSGLTGEDPRFTVHLWMAPEAALDQNRATAFGRESAWIAIYWRWRHNAVMAMQVTIRGVLEKVRNRLARCTAQHRESMQESLRGERGRIISRPSVGEGLQRVHERKEAAGSRVSFRSFRNPAIGVRGVDWFGARGTEAAVSANDATSSEFLLKEKLI